MAAKKIEIEIVGKGGDQAAAEIKKVESAQAELTETTQAAASTGVEDLDAQLEALKARAEALRENTEATEDLGEASADASEKSGDLDENVSKIARAQKAQAVAQLAGEVGKVGQKFKDVADEVESFDAQLANSLRNTGKNIEQTASAVSALALGFAVGGPLGAAAAGVGVVISELISSYVEAGQAAVEMEQKSAAAFDTLTDRLGKVASEKSALEFRTWLETLTAEEAAIELQNDALGRNRELLEAKLAAQAKLDAAIAKNKIAEIDANPDLSDADKIRQKAQVNEGLARTNVENQLNAQGSNVVAAEAAAAAKEAAAAKLAEAAQRVAERKAADDAEREELERKEKIRQRAKGELPGARIALDRAQLSESFFRGGILGDEKKQAEDAARKQYENLGNQAAENPRETIRLEELRKNQAEIDAAAEKTADEADRAAKEANRAKLAAENKRRILEETAPLAVATFQEESRGRQTQTSGAAAAAEQRAATQIARDEQRRQNEIAKQQREAAGIGRTAEGLVPKGASDELRKAVSKVATGLQNGDQGGELAEVVRQVNLLAEVVGVKGTKTETEITALIQKVSQLQGQIKNSRTGQ